MTNGPPDAARIPDAPDVFSGWGQNIADAREAHGFPTQRALAARLGVAPFTVSRWETGKMRPSYDMQLRIAYALGVTVTDLFYSNADEVDVDTDGLAS